MKIAAWVIGLVALATVATLAQGQQGNDLSTQPRPSRAFCSAAAAYDKATTTKTSVPLAEHNVRPRSADGREGHFAAWCAERIRPLSASQASSRLWRTL